MCADVSETDRFWQIIEDTRNGVLATIRRDGTPHLSNIYYLADRLCGTIRLSTTADRAKGRHLLRDPRAALYVAGPDFVKFAVAEGPVSLAIAKEPGDAAINELFEIHQMLGAATERAGFDDQMIANRRMVVRIRVERVHGLYLDRAPRRRTDT
jgi:PPOX class probable F420-dependent enzyme